MDRLTTRRLVVVAVVFLLLGLLYPTLEKSDGGRVLMLLLYGLTFFFSNFGPNSTTFILPSETFPSHIRTTLNGFSAAMGKVGATIGSAAFKPMKEAVGLQWTMIVCSFVSLAGLLLSVFFVEDRRNKSMEDEEQEDDYHGDAYSTSREWTPAAISSQ